jgi:hypothetical protein
VFGEVIERAGMGCMDYTSPCKYFDEILHPNVGCRLSSKYLLDAGFHNETNTNTHTDDVTQALADNEGWKHCRLEGCSRR